MMTEPVPTVAPVSRFELGLERTPRLIVRPRVLVAEGDSDIRTLLRWALRRDGCDVIESRTGDEMADYLTTSALCGDIFPPPDLILTDVDTPGTSVLDVLAQARPVLRRVPIVLLVENVLPGMEERLVGLGIKAIVGKPFDLDRVRAVVKGAIAV